MPEFRFSVPVQPSYGDIDAQWHVNNVRYIGYLEQARLTYLVKLGLWDGEDFNNLGLIVADVHISYLAPMTLWQTGKLELRTDRIGRKSLTFVYRLTNACTGQLLATAETVMVGFDYRAQRSISIPDAWREKISAFEGKSF